MFVKWFYAVVVLHQLMSSVQSLYKAYSADNFCGQNIYLSSAAASSAILRATMSKHYTGYGECRINVVPYDKKYGIVAHVNRVNLRSGWSSCQDYLKLYYDNGTQETSRMCKSSGNIYVSQPDTNATFQVLFYRDKDKLFIKKRNFEVVFTQYKIGSCDSNEFQCKIGNRCIWKDLKCDNMNNCGDFSDEECRVKSFPIISAIVGIVIVMLIVFGVLIVRNRLRSKMRSNTPIITTQSAVYSSPPPSIFQAPQPQTHYSQQQGPPFYQPPPPAYQPQQGYPGYPPQNNVYPPQNNAYPPQNSVYPPQNNVYPKDGAY